MNSNHRRTNEPTEDHGVLASLRALLPARLLRLSEALRIAERQADLFRASRGYADLPIPDDVLSGLPRIRIEPDPDLPRRAASGVSYWDGARRSWIIAVNPDEPAVRRRFTALHEFKHIIDHNHPGIARRGQRRGSETLSEYVADYFAGCALVPKRLLTSAYYDGIQRTTDLADLFGVSLRAAEVRLAQVGLAGPDAQPHPQYRRQRAGMVPAMTAQRRD